MNKAHSVDFSSKYVGRNPIQYLQHKALSNNRKMYIQFKVCKMSRHYN